MTDDSVTSESNVMRTNYRVLDEKDKDMIAAIKNQGLALHVLIASAGPSRETSLALTKVEEAIMWAVKHVTK